MENEPAKPEPAQSHFQKEAWGHVYHFTHNGERRSFYLIKDAVGPVRIAIVTAGKHELVALSLHSGHDSFLACLKPTLAKEPDQGILHMLSSGFIRRLHADDAQARHLIEEFASLKDATEFVKEHKVAVLPAEAPPIFNPPSSGSAIGRFKFGDYFCFNGLWIDSATACFYKHLCKWAQCIDEHPYDPQVCNDEWTELKGCIGDYE